MADDKSEKYELERIGATPTKNSGRGVHQKGDGIISVKGDPMFTVDVKEYGKSFAVSEKTWGKISADALKNSTKPLFKLVIGTEEPKTRVVVMSEEMFNLLMETYWMYEDLSD